MHVGLKLWLVAVIFELSSAVLSSHIEHHHIYDLFLNVVNNNGMSTMRAVPGENGRSTAHLMQGSNRNVQVAKDVVNELGRELANRKDFTILATLRQHERNTGSIITFSSLYHERLLEVESSGRRGEIRFHYLHNNKSRTEIFPYELSDSLWHKVAISISHNFLELFIDCHKVYERPLKKKLDFSNLPREEGLQIWLGQRGRNQGFFKGAVENIKIVTDTQGIKEQCPHASVACPTCSEFHNLEESVNKLYTIIDHLSQKLEAAEGRISELEECECMRSCDVDGTRYRDGESWRPDYCTKCTCREGSVECEQPKCPKIECQNPVYLDGQCCPTCLNLVSLLRTLAVHPENEYETHRGHCVFNGVRYDHGEGFSPKQCVICGCQDGRMTCNTEPEDKCPALNCPQEDQIAVPGECCKYCRGADYCGLDNDCHQNATCVNLATKYVCQCKDGHFGDGRHCEDRDECAEVGGRHGHHCGRNTECVNLPGTYQCVCKVGYIQVDPFRCEEVDECALGEHDCDENSDCVNTEGGYRCECRHGYEGSGQECHPVCEEPCLNGGRCMSPDVCQCRKGFSGLACEKDLDECELGMAGCHANSVCVNIPGSYRCDCRDGFYSNHPNSQHGSLCLDIDECAGWGEGHRCPVGTVCENTEGSYNCACLEEGACRGGCHFGDKLYSNGSMWTLEQDSCSVCECKNGEVKCRPQTCDCHAADVDLACCPRCEPNNKCQHQELPITYYSGDYWSHECHHCQCLDGETDCWPIECPVLTCRKTVQEDGDCCPRCAQPDPCLDSPEGFLDDGYGEMEKAADNKKCHYRDQVYEPLDRWTDDQECLSCICKGGHVCCSYSQICSHGQSKDKLHHRKERPKHRDKAANPEGVWGEEGRLDRHTAGDPGR